MLGPVRVIDRLRVSAHGIGLPRLRSAPRQRGGAAAPVRSRRCPTPSMPDEFRQRFSQAMIASPHLAAHAGGARHRRPARGPAGMARRAALERLAPARRGAGRLFPPVHPGRPGPGTPCIRRGWSTATSANASVFLTRGRHAEDLRRGRAALAAAGHRRPMKACKTTCAALGRIVSGWCTPSRRPQGPQDQAAARRAWSRSSIA